MLIKKRKIEVKTEIIVLTHNNIKVTKQFIELIYKNTKDFGLVIADNFSTDGTREYLKSLSYKNFSLSFHNKNEGIVRGRNLAYSTSLQISSNKYSEYVVFLDNDQFVKKDWLDSYLLLADKGYDVIGKEAWQMKKDFYPFRRIQSLNENFNYVGCGGMMIKNEVIKYMGLFDERFSPFYFEDPDFCFRSDFGGFRIGWNSANVIDHQKHNLTLSGERRKGFMKSWKKFKEKWKDYKMPIFNMRI